MNTNEKKATFIANKLNMKNGVIVNSGTIAILSALKLSNINPGDNVLINGYCCYSLFEAIKNIGANPVIIVPSNFFYISQLELEDAIKKYNIKCFIATHQYGIIQNIKEIKEKYPDLKIIEDIAQGWGIKIKNGKIGENSDYVVTSFGETKPLSYGQAGAIFSNNNLHDYFDFHDKESRNSKNVLLPYALYQCKKINEKNIVNNANLIVEKQKNIANNLSNYFKENSNIEIHKDEIGNESSWQRFPIIIKNKKYIAELERILNESNILYQWQNEKEVWELDMVKNSGTIVIPNEKPMYLLIRTRQNEIENIKKLIRSN